MKKTLKMFFYIPGEGRMEIQIDKVSKDAEKIYKTISSEEFDQLYKDNSIRIYIEPNDNLPPVA